MRICILIAGIALIVGCTQDNRTYEEKLLMSAKACAELGGKMKSRPPPRCLTRDGEIIVGGCVPAERWCEMPDSFR